MNRLDQQGGASALPIARAFVEVGGRILIDPSGKLKTGGNLACFFLDSSPQEARRSFVIGRRFHRRLRDKRFARSVAALVASEGQPVNGWLVLEGRGSAKQ